MQAVDIALDDPAPRRAPANALAAWWRTLPGALRAPVWPGTLAGLVILALLLGFHHVVRDAVHQGELLRMSTASRAEAVRRCNAMPRASVRASCLAQVDAPPPVRGEAGPPPNTASLSLASTRS
ncbi:MAG TPA: hypothetical protein VFB53_05335 [Burkholderiales bacterium]|nr:hypothetical protein [Burkholderiales bacterium]